MLITPMSRLAMRTVTIAGLALTFHSSFAAPVSWEAAADFSPDIKSNVNGVWSYGLTPTLNGEFSLMTRKGPSNQVYRYWDGGDYKPSLGKAIDAAVGGSWKVPANTINMHPGANGEYSVLRFQALNDGDYTIDVDFWANHSTSTDIHVRTDGVEQFSTLINSTKTYASPANWISTVTLSAGDFIDFMVGRGGLPNSTWSNDSTGIAALISFTAPVLPPSGTTPEPSGLLLMASGLGLAAFARRRKPI